MPLSNMARNCFRQGRVEDMIAMWVVMVVMIVTPTLV
jgi:pentatricopeptide repeat protein